MVVFGDVEGNINQLKELIDPFLGKEEIYALGDLVDRGENSKAVINYIRDNNINFITGNHCDWFIQFAPELAKCNEDIVEDEDFRLWMHNGGWQTLESYGYEFPFKNMIHNISYNCSNNKEKLKVLLEDALFLKQQGKDFFFFDNEEYKGKKILLTHAPFLKYFLEDREGCFKEENIYPYGKLSKWLRRAIPSAKMQNAGIVNIHGHNPYTSIDGELEEDEFYVNLDTGISAGGCLTALNTKTHEIHQVK